MNTDPSLRPDPNSVWLASAHLPSYPPLQSDLTVDVVVVGGGITGITAAFLLKRAGLTVALLERDRCLRVDTGHTTAHLTAVVDERFQDLARNHSPEAARAVWDAGAAAIDQIDRVIRAEKIACDFRWAPGYLHAAESRLGDGELLEREAGICNELGIRCEFLEAVPFFATPGVRFPQQALFNPVAYLAPLLASIDGHGSRVCEGSEAAEFFDDPKSVRVGDHRIRFDHVVLATHTPLTGLNGLVSSMLFQTKLALYTSYALGARIPAGSLPIASFWDTADPYHYLRIEPRGGHDYAIYGGEDHKTGQTEDTEACYERLIERFLTRVPEAQVEHRWSGQVIETPDGLPYCGWAAPGQFIATGFSGNGMTFGTLGAMMAVDAITGKTNPWSKLFDPHRTKLRGAALEFLKENKDYPYYLLRDRLAGAPEATGEDIPPGEGRLVKIEGKKVAAFRDENSQLTLCSPVCSHLGCIVAWNAAEHTWDCPCHGSRFKPTGEVISGPAESPLERVPPKGPAHA